MHQNRPFAVVKQDEKINGLVFGILPCSSILVYCILERHYPKKLKFGETYPLRLNGMPVAPFRNQKDFPHLATVWLIDTKSNV